MKKVFIKDLRDIDEEMIFKWILTGELDSYMTFVTDTRRFWIKRRAGRRLLYLLRKHGVTPSISFSDGRRM